MEALLFMTRDQTRARACRITSAVQVQRVLEQV